MHDLPRQKLRKLIIEYGRSLCGDPRRCEALLKDYCGQYKREIFVLISALKERVAYELINFQDNIPEVILLGRLVKRLQEDLALTEDAAKWTVESWRIALSNIPYEPNHKDIQHHIFAAEQGNSNAQTKLGWIYQNGQGITQNYQEAIRWYQLAAQQGDPIAQNNLGVLYHTLSQYVEALKWISLSANNGNSTAQYNLFIIYNGGLGVAKNYQVAEEWFQLALKKENAAAQNIVGVIYSTRYKDHKEANKYFRLAAEKGDDMAQLNFGSSYINGDGVDIDYQEGIKWWRLSAENGNILAQEAIGLEYFIGNFVNQDYQEAFKWLSLSAEQENASAQEQIGRMYEQGLGVEQDIQEAIKWYKLATSHGSKEQVRDKILIKMSNRIYFIRPTTNK